MTLLFVDDCHTIEDLLMRVSQHEKDAPTHGSDCACLDSVIRKLRGMLRIEGSDNYKESGTPGSAWRQQTRIDHVLRLALRR